MYDNTQNKIDMKNSYSSSFTPFFLDNAQQNQTFTNSSEYQSYINKCAGISSCISDAIITGYISFGVQTKNSFATQQTKNNLLSN